MITQTELQELLQSTETYRVERTTSTGVPQDVPQGVTQDDTQGDTQDDTQGDFLDVLIETQIMKNPKVTTEKLAKLSNKGVATIKRHLAKLPHIQYVGSGYSGHWAIVNNKRSKQDAGAADGKETNQ